MASEFLPLEVPVSSTANAGEISCEMIRNFSVLSHNHPEGNDFAYAFPQMYVTCFKVHYEKEQIGYNLAEITALL